MMENSIVVIRQNDTGGQRHGGWRVYRHFDVFVNGSKVETFSDDSPRHGYSSGKHLDDCMNDWLNKWSGALKCHVIRGKASDFKEGSGNKIN